MTAEFENDVKMYGTETHALWLAYENAFENDVKMYGTETDALQDIIED